MPVFLTRAARRRARGPQLCSNCCARGARGATCSTASRLLHQMPDFVAAYVGGSSPICEEATLMGRRAIIIMQIQRRPRLAVRPRDDAVDARAVDGAPAHVGRGRARVLESRPVLPMASLRAATSRHAIVPVPLVLSSVRLRRAERRASNCFARKTLRMRAPSRGLAGRGRAWRGRRPPPRPARRRAGHRGTRRRRPLPRRASEAQMKLQNCMCYPQTVQAPRLLTID